MELMIRNGALINLRKEQSIPGLRSLDYEENKELSKYLIKSGMLVRNCLSI